jgi:[ribosomal protein S18]-alanine N-acetyltransferase
LACAKTMDTNLSFTFHKINAVTAREIATWQYPPPYDVYSYDPNELEENLQELLTPRFHYYTVWNTQGELIGYRCFGEDARVPGGDYNADALDMGGGLRPELTGKGLGARFMEAAFTFAREQFAPTAFRATVMAFNTRALRVCARVGYRQVQKFESAHTQQPFIVLMREANL